MAVSLGKDFVLVLKRTPDLTRHLVAIVDSVEDAISTWDWSTRISPIYLLGDSQPPDINSSSSLQLHFVGPIAPALLPAEITTFLTFGIYNALLVAENDKQREIVSNFLSSKPSLKWETWQVQNGRVESWTCSDGLREGAARTPVKSYKLTSAGLRSAHEENSALLAASIAKARRYFPELADEFETFRDVFFTKLTSKLHDHEITKLSWLVNVNAHLSRYTSQTFSGTSPIIETESHFWTHSLLGVGIATQALIQIRRFVEHATAKFDPIEKLESFKNIPAYQCSLIQLRPTHDEAWGKIAEAVKRPDENESFATESGTVEPRMPLIVCFSGRDGFRSTLFSLSAPLEVISCCNTAGWTPMTLTHEMCHVWVNGILGKLFPKLADPKHAQELERITESSFTPQNLFQQVQQMMYFCFTRLYCEEFNISLSDEDDIPAEKQRNLVQIIESQSLAVNELLTHIMDFHFFYQRDDEIYIKSIWSSWDVIPNIKDRIEDYILRSACALLSGRLNQKDAVNTTLDRLATLLQIVEGTLQNGQYLTEAQKLLAENREGFVQRINYRLYLVRLAYSFFTDQDLASLLQHERPESGGPYNSMTPKSFASSDIVSNPLLFIATFSHDHKIDRAKSLWILQNLAFADHVHTSA